MTGQQGPGVLGVSCFGIDIWANRREEPVAHQTKTQKEGASPHLGEDVEKKGGGGTNERHTKVAGEDTSVLCRYVS